MPEPSGPRALSTIVTRTLRVPKSTPATTAILVRVAVPIRLPAEVAHSRFADGGVHCGEIRRDVMLEAVLANVMQQLLHFGNFDDAGAAESFERIVGELS